MGGACGTNGGKEKCIEDIGGKIKRKRDHSADKDVYRWIMLNWILER
jgi:hypothetical protein